MTDAALDYASGSQQFDPNGQNQWETQFIENEAEGDQANNASGILSGFKMPPDMTAGDLKQMTTAMEDYANEVGWKHMPNPQQVVDAWRAGVHDYQGVAKMWGAKLPPSLGWVKHGMTQAAFSKYKEDNKQAILTRYGAHGDAKDENFTHNLDNPLNAFSASGAAVGSAPQQVDTMQKSDTR